MVRIRLGLEDVPERETSSFLGASGELVRGRCHCGERHGSRFKTHRYYRNPLGRDISTGAVLAARRLVGLTRTFSLFICFVLVLFHI